MAASVDVNRYLVQTFRSRSMEKPIAIPVQIDSATQKGFILWQDIERVFGEPKYVKRRCSMVVVFTRDSNFQNVLPLRIDHFPGEELEVVVEHSIHFATSREHAEPTEPSPPSPARNTDDASRITNIDTNTDAIDQSSSGTSPPTTPRPHHLYAYRAPEMSGEEKEAVAMACVEQTMEQKEAACVEKTMERPPPGLNKGILSPEFQFYRRSQEQLLEKHNQLHELQLRAREESLQQHQAVVEMQQQIIDRLTLIQTRLQTLLTQTYELHEYPIPRLFIVVPKELRVRDKLAKPFAEQFRLYFLCECGSHTHNKNSMIPNEIHLAKHEGYDVDRPTEFFRKYGTYIMAMIYLIKYGISVSGVVVPQLTKLNFVGDLGSLPKNVKYLKDNIVPLVDSTISFIQGVNGDGHGKARNTSASITAEYTNDRGHMGSEPAFIPAEFDASTSVLEGADLRQLESFLKGKDKGRVLGNLYRMVTDEGHVKWVCFDHYRVNYRESAIKALDEVVQSYKGTYCQETGTIEIKLGSHIQAKHFYNAMVKGRGIQELNVTFGWDASMDDLRHFATAALKAGLVRVSVDGANLKKPPLDIAHRRRRFEPLLQLAFNSRIQSLELRNIDRFFVRVGDEAMKRAPMLRVFALDSEIPYTGETDSYFHKFLEDCPFLVSLELKLHRRFSIQYATTEILTKLHKLEKLKLDCGTIAIQAAITYGKILDISMTIVRLCDLSDDDVEFIQQNHVSQLAIEYTPESPDEDRLVDILDNSSRLSHLWIGCQDRRFGALIDLVVGSRSRMLQDQRSPGLQTFELMDEGLVPFNEESDFDTETHIHCVLTFKEDNGFEMCSQVRLQCDKLVTEEDPICDFILQYGSSIEFFDAPLTFSNHLAAILDEMTSSGASRLKRFNVDPLSLSKPGRKHLRSILDRLANSSDLGIYMDDQESPELYGL